MSVKIMGLVWDLDKSIISRPQKYVLLAYVDHADHNGKNIFPSVELIAQKTGYEERAVQLITRSLVRDGFLIPDGKGPNGTNKWAYGGGAKNAPVQKIHRRGAKNAPLGVNPFAPESSDEPSSEPSNSDAPAVELKATEIPELVVYREIVSHWPKRQQRDLVVQAVKDVGARLGKFPGVEDLKPFFAAWCKVSGNDWSLVWLTDWAVSGTVNGKGQVQNGTTQNGNAAVYSASDVELAERIKARRAAERAQQRAV